VESSTAAIKLATRWVQAKRPKYSAGFLYYCPDDDTVFLTKRSGMMHHPHCWDLPGGRSKKSDESIEETAQREATEELGRLPTEALQVSHHVETFKKDDGENYHYYIYLVRVSEAEKVRWTPLVELNEESEGFKWFKIDELPDKIHFDLSWIPKAAKEIKSKSNMKAKTASTRLVLASEVFKPRYEFKYWLPVERIASIRDFIAPYAHADLYGPTYRIRNIYLDNDRLDLFSDHMLHKGSHYKLRARTYNGSDEVFLEVKHKARGVCSKSRSVVPAGKYEEVLRVAATQDHIPFLKLAKERNGHPVVMIDYDREAYSLGESNGRITIDTDIRYAAHDNYAFDGSPLHRVIPKTAAILELKFSGTFPELMGRVVKAFDLERSSISKYCRSISGMLEDGVLAPVYRRP
jgi:8-oxo-dGTP pyrophosphatase MutT (NUDIX family)